MALLIANQIRNSVNRPPSDLPPRRTMRERYRGASKKTKALIGLTALAATTGGLLAVENLGKTGVKTNAGVYEVTRTFTMPPKTCHGGYDVSVKGATANLKHTLSFIPLIDVTETFNGSITAEICNADDPNKAVYTRHIKDANGHRTIDEKFGNDAFTATVYQTNPMDPNAFQYNNGPASAIVRMAGDFISALPGNLHLSGPDQLENYTRGLVLQTAYADAIQGCGGEAWGYLKQPYEQEIKKEIVADNNFYNPEHPVTMSDVTVETPDPKDINFKSQYDDQMNTMKGALHKQGVDVSWGKIDHCTRNTNVKQDVY